MTQTCRHWREPEWMRLHKLEDLMALVSEIEDHTRIIKRQAWREGSWDQVYDEAVATQGDLEKLKLWLSDLWSKWIAEAETPA